MIQRVWSSKARKPKAEPQECVGRRVIYGMTHRPSEEFACQASVSDTLCLDIGKVKYMAKYMRTSKSSLLSINLTKTTSKGLLNEC
jgi:hypothetical protein